LADGRRSAVFRLKLSLDLCTDASALANKNLSCWKRHIVGKEGHLGEVMLLTAMLGVVSATARILFQHPIKWTDGAADDLGGSPHTEIRHSLETL
jgi:hypothetical protein